MMKAFDWYACDKETGMAVRSGMCFAESIDEAKKLVILKPDEVLVIEPFEWAVI